MCTFMYIDMFKRNNKIIASSTLLLKTKNNRLYLGAKRFVELRRGIIHFVCWCQGLSLIS